MPYPRLLSLLAALGAAGCTGAADDPTGETDTAARPDTDPNLPDACSVRGITCDGDLATLTGTITEDVTLTRDRTWVLSGKVEIGEGGSETEEPTLTAVLTIEAGTTILGTAGSFLAINRGSRILADGTADAPIVFTPEATALGEPRRPGDWGGLVINGRAPINKCATPGCTAAGEAGTGWFGGDDPNDDSGLLAYVRVEFGGFDVLPDEELNGITFAGVGRGTEVHHVQVHANDDDGVEFFGGTVDVRHLVVSCVKDDGIDTDLGYTGRIQHALVVQCPDFPESSDPSGSENDNQSADNTATPVSAPVLSNVTFVGRAAASSPTHGLVLRRGSALELHNSIVTGFGTSCIDVRDAATAPVIAHTLLDCDTPFGSEAAEEVFLAGEGNLTGDAKLAQTALPLGGDPDFRPAADSPAASGAVQPGGAFFDAVGHLGAFAPGGEDWTDGWTAFPRN